jgi:hypothetical protein
MVYKTMSHVTLPIEEPIALSWLGNQTDVLEMKNSIIYNDFNNILVKEAINDGKKGKANNACRTSNRQKKKMNEMNMHELFSAPTLVA